MHGICRGRGIKNKFKPLRDLNQKKYINLKIILWGGISDVDRSDFNMPPDWKGFSEKICQVEGTFDEGNHILVLSYAVTNPVEAHVYALRLFRPYCGLC